MRSLFIPLSFALALAACEIADPTDLATTDTAALQRGGLTEPPACTEEPSAERANSCCSCEWTPGTTTDIECGYLADIGDCDWCCEMFDPGVLDL